jgi:hypothetical protein
MNKIEQQVYDLHDRIKGLEPNPELNQIMIVIRNLVAEYSFCDNADTDIYAKEVLDFVIPIVEKAEKKSNNKRLIDRIAN